MTNTLLTLLLQSTPDSGGGGALGAIIGLVYLGILVLLIAGCWKVFTKAGQPGWACIVPIYGFIVFLQIVGRPLWWIVLMLIPGVNFIVGIILCLDLAKVFGKGSGFAVGLLLLCPVFVPMLGFGDAKYQGAKA